MTCEIFNKVCIIWYTVITPRKQVKNKRYDNMNLKFNIKLKIIKRELESLRAILHFLLNFKKPTDKLVVSCSQQLDEIIVKYHKVKATCKKVA